MEGIQFKKTEKLFWMLKIPLEFQGTFYKGKFGLGTKKFGRNHTLNGKMSENAKKKRNFHRTSFMNKLKDSSLLFINFCYFLSLSLSFLATQSDSLSSLETSHNN